MGREWEARAAGQRRRERRLGGGDTRVVERARLEAGQAQKTHALRVLLEHIAPGAWDNTRQPNRKELAATSVLALDLTEANSTVPKDFDPTRS